ncbi:MAG: hypothetical protein PHH54_05950 [Candidatus Nanoarchaeia archaeon]|nr:hypothetical protein [Candidatus Nanoarchaeia archaeon]MDD5741497.1 hypothetical protein [Candidatus Nanoarchaeia archaeon]
MVNKLTIASYLEPFLTTEGFIHLSELARKVGKNHTVVRLYANNLEKQGILEKKIVGRLTMYQLKSSPILLDYLVLAEKERLIAQCQKDLILKEIVGFLHELLDHENKALIFGSATMNARKAGDVDILITGKFDESKIKELEKRLNIEAHLISTKDLNSITPSLKKEILNKHLIIQGSEEIVKWLKSI